MDILISTETGTLTAELAATPAAQAFAALLPLTLELTDYAATEKIADLPKKLTTLGEPAGMKPVIGDITYYAPWGNLAIFHKDFGYANGLVKLGHIKGNLSILLSGDAVSATFTLAE